MRYEYEVDGIVYSLFDLSHYSGVPVTDLLEVLTPAVFDTADLDYINKNWDVKSEG